MRPPWLPWLDHVGSNKSMDVPTHLWVSRSIFKAVAYLDQGLSIFPSHIYIFFSVVVFNAATLILFYE